MRKDLMRIHYTLSDFRLKLKMLHLRVGCLFSLLFIHSTHHAQWGFLYSLLPSDTFCGFISGDFVIYCWPFRIASQGCLQETEFLLTQYRREIGHQAVKQVLFSDTTSQSMWSLSWMKLELQKEQLFMCHFGISRFWTEVCKEYIKVCLDISGTFGKVQVYFKRKQSSVLLCFFVWMVLFIHLNNLYVFLSDTALSSFQKIQETNIGKGE